MASSRGEQPRFAGSKRGQNGPNAGESRGTESSQEPHPAGVSADLPESDAKPRLLRGNAKTASYPQPLAAASR